MVGLLVGRGWLFESSFGVVLGIWVVGLLVASLVGGFGGLVGWRLVAVVWLLGCMVAADLFAWLVGYVAHFLVG